MDSKTYVIPFVAAAVVALVVGSAVAAYILASPSENSAVSVPLMAVGAMQNNESTSTLPVRLLIPDLHINTLIQQVGRNAEENMRAPTNFTNVAWYEGGPQPGAEGSAVIAGHLDNALGLNGVFKHLSGLQVGQSVEIQTVAGGILNFRVVDIEEYPYTQVPGELFTKTGGAYLNLITCAGVWLPQEKTYDHRLVVYTALTS
jgi:sortase (surface protein transpeptidase)